jgi:exo-1,4-beta-D-glucosaminidase
VRCQLFGSHGQLVVNNVYWVSQRDDDVGPRENDQVMTLKQERWADMTALNDLPPVALEATASETKTGQDHHVTIRLRNTSNRIAFFERVSLRADRDGDEILPVEYDDNYITVFPGETEELHGTTWKGPEPKWITLEGYNTRAVSIPVR